jgi:hypothetical protein
MLRSERRLIALLQEAGATAPERAIPVPALHPLARLRYQRLSSVGAINTLADGRCYLDLGEWNAYMTRRRIRLGYAILAVVAIVLLAHNKLR